MLTRIAEFVGGYDPRAYRARSVERLALEQDAVGKLEIACADVIQDRVAEGGSVP